MQISSRFTISLHMLACIDRFEGERKVTSGFLAGSVNCNPVIIRRLLGLLKAAGLITVTRGSGGASLARPPEKITFYDVYLAVGCVDQGKLFHFHEKPSVSCPVGRNIHKALDDKLERTQRAMEDEMRKITLADVSKDLSEHTV